MSMIWISTEARPLTEDDGEVVAYHPDWVDEDYNENGTRVGFFQEGVFISAEWNNYQDTYSDNDALMPSHYMHIPKNPDLQEDKPLYESITEQRFEGWKHRLSKLESTPIMTIVMGLSGPRMHDISLVAIEELDNSLIKGILKKILRQFSI